MTDSTRYYLVSSEYVGPNASNLSTDFDRIVYGHYVDIRTVPGTTNMSHEPRTDGWLGTTNDWAEYAHGEYATLEDARAARAEMFPQTFASSRDDEDLMVGLDDDDEPIEAVERVYVGPGENVVDAETWLYDAAREDLSAETSDEQLAELAAEYKKDAAIDKIILWDDVEEFLRQIRDEMRSEADDA